MLRKVVLTSFIILAIVLFINGAYLLGKTDNDDAGPKTYPHEGYEYNGQPLQEQSSISYDGPLNLLLLGLDEYGERSDVIVLLSLNSAAKRLNILSIARDTKVYANGKATKINALIGMGGEKLIISKVEEITGLDMNYYLTLDFRGFRKVIDILGGVEFYVPFDMNYDDPEQNLHIHLKKGSQFLNGQKAEQFVRYRKGNREGEGYIEGDIGRIKAQQDFMKALMQQKLKLRYLSKADDILNISKQYMRTNININDITTHFKEVSEIGYENVSSYTIPGESDYANGLWYFICDLSKTRELVKSNFY